MRKPVFSASFIVSENSITSKTAGLICNDYPGDQELPLKITKI
jgi:hypothetical protein